MARIALAESDSAVRGMATRALESQGHEVDAFEDGAAALLALGERSFDLLIGAVTLPRLDGVSLCRAVRDRPTFRPMPVVLLTDPEGEETLEAYRAGADDCVVKPISPDVLRARVDQALHASRVWTPALQPPLPKGEIELPSRFDRFELHDVLGVGGYSTVYRGVDPTGKEVALKLFEDPLVESRAALTRYFREVSVLRNVDSPGIAPILGSGFARGRFYIVMKLVLGLSAGELLHEFGPFSVEEASRLGRDVARALYGLCRHGLVHRDIKPANVMIQPTGECVLVDFGLVKGPGDISITQSREMIGTGPYMAPEVIRGPGNESVASDLYALGASVYELLTGQLPFAGEGLVLFRKIASGEPAPRVDRLRPGLPRGLVALVHRLLHPDPKFRLADPLRAATAFDATA